MVAQQQLASCPACGGTGQQMIEYYHDILHLNSKPKTRIRPCLACYATGRGLSYNEIAFLKEHGIKLKSGDSQMGDYRMQDVLRFVIKSDIFLKK